ncbi:MAG TPA: septum formation protein Maf [Ruminococcaceae bacterium]|nr:septum formation protein Maf [Oscillospiraceae bacterium]HCA30886.1 septum formation protein Maf [Oscillospiraceae bacterium]
MEEVILASASPRRQEILKLLDIPFTVLPSTDECQVDTSLPISEAVLKVAQKKAEGIAKLHPNRTVIGADTVVTVNGQILGKPKDERQAAEMLGMLSGRVHRVYTAVWVCKPGHPDRGGGFTDAAKVDFYPLTREEINDYIATGEPMDKSGGYGIQGRGLRFIRSICGDFYTVMGLPGARLWRFLKNYDCA